MGNDPIPPQDQAIQVADLEEDYDNLWRAILYPVLKRSGRPAPPPGRSDCKNPVRPQSSHVIGETRSVQAKLNLQSDPSSTQAEALESQLDGAAVE